MSPLIHQSRPSVPAFTMNICCFPSCFHSKLYEPHPTRSRPSLLFLTTSSFHFLLKTIISYSQRLSAVLGLYAESPLRGMRCINSVEQLPGVQFPGTLLHVEKALHSPSRQLGYDNNFRCVSLIRCQLMTGYLRGTDSLPTRASSPCFERP